MSNILIVDDSILMRRNLRILLQQAGHTVVAEASDGMQGFTEYEKHLPDLVTMDITMPLMNGIDSVKRIIAKYPQANIVMISALDQKNMVFEAIQSGAKHYILKPITIEKILSTINSILQISPPEHSDATAVPPTKSKVRVAPFEIENKNGIFIVTIHPTINAEALMDLELAIQGFLYIKPLKLIFEFKQMTTIQDEVLQGIQRFYQDIEQADGVCRVVCSDLDLIMQLKNKKAFDRIYTEVAQTIL
jgi:DNA-binding NarL/FixJ family response regulator